MLGRSGMRTTSKLYIMYVWLITSKIHRSSPKITNNKAVAKKWKKRKQKYISLTTVYTVQWPQVRKKQQTKRSRKEKTAKSIAGPASSRKLIGSVSDSKKKIYIYIYTAFLSYLFKVICGGIPYLALSLSSVLFCFVFGLSLAPLSVILSSTIIRV